MLPGRRMTRPDQFLIRMALFMVAVAAVAGVLHDPLIRAFMANPALNGMILAVFLIGAGNLVAQVVQLRPEVEWIESFRRREPGLTQPRPPVMLAPMAAMLREKQGKVTLSSVALRGILDSIAARLDESREIARYITGLLVFLGLLGTFWGLLETVSGVSGAIRNLKAEAGADAGALFNQLRTGLEAPLAGMGIAFSSSLLGLAGSLVTGFLDILAGQAQSRFYMELEDWLAGLTRVGTAGAGGGELDSTVPAYVSSLLEQTADSLDGLQRTIREGEESRQAVNAALMTLSERLGVLTERMRNDSQSLSRVVDFQRDLRPFLERLAAEKTLGGGDEINAATAHLRNIELLLARLIEEQRERIEAAPPASEG